MKHRAAIVKGDGIGPEISAATQRVLAAAGAEIEWIEVRAGDDALRRCGEELPAATLDAIEELGVALKAPLIAPRLSGGVTVRRGGREAHYPSVNNALRRELGLFVNVRPVRRGEMDLVIMREVTEDVYIGIERQVDADTAEAIKRITRAACERIARYSCEYARKHGRRSVMAIHKANVLHLTDGLFLRAVRKVVEGEYPDLRFEEMAIDACCYNLVKKPGVFDVLVLPNQYGDIVSDLAAGIAGSLGLAPGANIGERGAMFEAAHGAAPDIAGMGIANPMGLVLSGAMLLDHIGEGDAAARVRDAVSAVVEEGRALTPDLGGRATTEQLTEALEEQCRAGLRV